MWAQEEFGKRRAVPHFTQHLFGAYAAELTAGDVSQTLRVAQLGMPLWGGLVHGAMWGGLRQISSDPTKLAATQIWEWTKTDRACGGFEGVSTLLYASCVHDPGRRLPYQTGRLRRM